MIQSTYMESENSGRTKAMGKASLVAPLVKNLSAAQETWVQSLRWQIPWRREGQPAPVFLPRVFHGQRNLGGCRLWGRTESGTTEVAWQQLQQSG